MDGLCYKLVAQVPGEEPPISVVGGADQPPTAEVPYALVDQVGAIPTRRSACKINMGQANQTGAFITIAKPTIAATSPHNIQRTCLRRGQRQSVPIPIPAAEIPVLEDAVRVMMTDEIKPTTAAIFAFQCSTAK